MRGCFCLLRRHNKLSHLETNKSTRPVIRSGTTNPMSTYPSHHCCGIWVNLQCAVTTNLPALFVLAITGPSCTICSQIYQYQFVISYLSKNTNQVKPKPPTAKTFLLVLEVAPPFRLWLLTIFYAKNMEFTGGNTHTKKKK